MTARAAPRPHGGQAVHASVGSYRLGGLTGDTPLLTLELFDEFGHVNTQLVRPARPARLTGGTKTRPQVIANAHDPLGRLALLSRCHVITVAAAYALSPLIAGRLLGGKRAGAADDSRLVHRHEHISHDSLCIDTRETHSTVEASTQ